MIQTSDFATRTEIYPRQYGSSPSGVCVVGLDIGYSSAKAVSDDIACILPNYAVRDPGRELIGGLSTDCIQYRDLDTGEPWHVGRLALDGMSDEDSIVSESSLYGRNRYDDMFCVIARTAIGIALSKKKTRWSKVMIQTGLPPKYLGRGSWDKNALVSALSGRHHFAIQIGTDKPIEYDFVIVPEDVFVMPQPMGTLFSVSVGNDGSMIPGAIQKFVSGGNRIVFDGGFGTLDTYAIKDKTTMGSETFTDLGMRRVFEEVAEIVRTEYNKELPIPAMQRHLRDGYFRTFDQKTFSSKNIPLADIIQQCSDKICDLAIDRLFQTYPVYEYDVMIVTGGTGTAWLPHIREKLQGMETLEIYDGASNDNLPATFANARGFYWYLRSLLATNTQE